MKNVFHFVVILLVMVFFSNCANKPEPKPSPEKVTIEYLTPPEMAQLNLPFSEAVRVGNTLYLSGQIGNLPGTKNLVEGGVQAETKQTMDNIKATLQRYGADMDDIVKCTIFLADIEEWPSMNEVYVTYFPGHKPARSAVAGSGLALGARVEIECIAVIQ